MRYILRIILSLSLLLPLQAAFAQQTNESRKAQLEREIEILDRQIRDNANQSASALSRLSLVQTKISARQALIRESDAEISRIGNQIAGKQREINVLTARLDTMTLYYGRLVRGAYKNRDARVWYMYILASDNLGQGLRRYSYLRRLSSELNVRGRELKEERDTLEAIKSRLELLQADARQLRDERASEVDKLHKEEDRSKALIARLQGDRQKYINQLSNKRKEVEALNREIERMIAAEMEGSKGKGKGGSGGKKTSSKIDTALSEQFSANKGKLPWPAEGRVTGHFGRSQHPVYSKVEMPFNNGVNLAVDPDSPVKAVFNGTVKQIVVIPGYNQCILVQHGEYFTFYCKMGSVAVKAGDKVKTGQVLGHVATIAGETQLHFQLWQGKTPQDPEKWLR